MRKFSFCLVAFLAWAAGWWSCLTFSSHHSRAVPAEVVVTETDTLVVTDTIEVCRPVTRVERVLEVVERVLPVAAAPGDDSVAVAVERTQREYSDSLWHAWVSGYEPSLDSLVIFAPRTTIRTTAVRRPQPRWAVTAGAGLGVTPRGVSPYVGITVGFVIKSF